MSARVISAAAAFDSWVARVSSDEPEPRYGIGGGFEHVDVAPGRVVLLTGAPGSGKTALAMQWCFAALEKQPDMRVLVSNVEMSVAQLLDRLLAHASQVCLTDIRERRATGMKPGFERIAAVADRLFLMESGFDMGGVYAAAAETGADVVCLDYIQRFGLGSDEHEGSRIARIMSGVLDMATQGAAAIVVSAAARQRGISGNASYGGLGLASGRGSSELEFACDSMYTLASGQAGTALMCVKERNNEPVSIALYPDLQRMTFKAGARIEPGDTRPRAGKGKTGAGKAALAAAWTAGDGGE